MNKNLLINIILMIFIYFFGLGTGLYVGKQISQPKVLESEVIKVLEPKESKLIERRYYNITGIVKAINYEQHVVTLTMDDEEMKIKIDTDEVKSILPKHLPPDSREPATVTFKDISIGDKLTTFAIEQENGELIGVNAYLSSP